MTSAHVLVASSFEFDSPALSSKLSSLPQFSNPTQLRKAMSANTNGHYITPSLASEVKSVQTQTDESSTTVEPVFAFDAMSDALAAFRAGEFLLVMDDESRENEGDLIIAADSITTEKMAWFIRVTSGYICIALPGDACDRLQLPAMVANNTENFKTAYTVTADYKFGTTTGISAHDRALTARKLAEGAPAHEFSRPGHMVPLRARDGGVLVRKGHTESAVDLCRLTGHAAAGLLCELVNDDAQGTMARRDDCRAFANKHGVKMISVEMIAKHIASQQEHQSPATA